MSTAMLLSLWTDRAGADRLGRRHDVDPDPPPVGSPSPVWLEGRWRAWSEAQQGEPIASAPARTRHKRHWSAAALAHVHVRPGH